MDTSMLVSGDNEESNSGNECSLSASSSTGSRAGEAAVKVERAEW